MKAECFEETGGGQGHRPEWLINSVGFTEGIEWKSRQCCVCPCPHQRDRDISRPACLNDWTIKPSEEIKPCLSVCFLLGSFQQHYCVGLRNHVYQKCKFVSLLIRLLFCGSFWWTRHECFSGKKNTLIDLIWWKHLTWLLLVSHWLCGCIHISSISCSTVMSTYSVE